MQIVSDRGMDMTPELAKEYNIHFAPLRIELEGKSYVSGENLESEQFYQLLSETDHFPTTSQPSSGEFAEIYRKLAKTDPEILSIHISSGLSGTINSARAGAEMVPEAHVTIVDSKTLSAPLGWQVEAAARAVKAGLPLDKVLKCIEQVAKSTEGFYTLANLNYLIHGGRISHLKGLVASLLNIKPVIGVERELGKYVTHGQEITLKRAIGKMVDVVSHFYPNVKQLRVQLLHGKNPDGVELLKQKITQVFECQLLPTLAVAPVLGAHTGPSLVGLSVAPLKVFTDLP